MSVNSKDEDGRTILHHTKGDISELLARGADPNIADEGGWTPLMCAASSGDLIKVKLLINHEIIDVNLTNETGCTALHYASSKGHIDIVSALLQKEGISLNIQEKYGKSTPLIRSITNNYTNIAKKLIENGARTNFKDCDGNTALHYAIAMENLDIAVLLINNGALYNIENDLGKIPLDVASYYMKNRLEEEI